MLTAKQREIIALAVGQVNECQYCLSAHTLMGKGAGLSPDGIRKAREGGAESDFDAAVAAPRAPRRRHTRPSCRCGSRRRPLGRSRRCAHHRGHRQRRDQRLDQLTPATSR
ncbi:carboxymuconolactone decarboxylase family protein [Bradyrhizobium betae]